MSIKVIKKVACYVRVSTENQLENYSIDEQIDRLKAFCKAKDYAISKFYIDGGYSGGNLNRPELQKMLMDIEINNIDIILVYKLDRLSRSQKDTLTLIEDNFLSNNIDFISISENFDTSTPFGRAMIGILSVFAQLEKDQITERFTMGRIGRAKNGYYHGGSIAPTGYNYIDGNLVIDEYEALQVKEVFNRFLDGQSINAIQRYMNKHYTNKYGNWNSHTLVLNILKNNVYIGKVKFRGNVYDGNHIPIISLETYNEVQKILTSSRRENSKTLFQKNPFKANNLLTSLLYCKKCGARFCGNHGNYVCYSRGKTDKRKIIDPNCKNKKWDIITLDTIIKNEILDTTLNRAYYNEIISHRNLTSDVNILNKRINDINNYIIKLIDLDKINKSPIEQISNKIIQLNKEKNIIKEQIKDNELREHNLHKSNNIYQKLSYVLDHGELYQKRMIISNLIDYINIDDESIEIHWSFN